MRTYRTLAVVAVLLLGATEIPCAAQAAAGQADIDKAIEQARKDARTDVNTLITVSMQFSSEDAAKFWPLYSTYERHRKALNDERIAVVKEYADTYGKLTDAKAAELTSRAMAVEEKAAVAKRGFLTELQKVLPGKTVARFYQVHTRIDALLNLTLAGQIPLVQ